MKHVSVTGNLDKNGPEFEHLESLDTNSLTIATLGTVDTYSESDLEKFLEKRLSRALDPIVKSIMGIDTPPTNNEHLRLTLDRIALKIPSVQIANYFRAGKRYITVTHRMGHVGNLLFKSIFDSTVQQNQEYYLQLHENNITIICRN